MAKTVLGVDIGYDTLKLALCKGNWVRKTASAPMPKNLMREGRVTSTETMGQLIRDTMRQSKMRASEAALVFNNETSYVRTVTMPIMSAEQLEINVPYEFNDYITDELKNYVFDYAMISTPEDLRRARDEAADDTAPTMELMISAVQKSLLDEGREVLRKAGLKLVKAAPSLCGYISLIRNREGEGGTGQEYCILDLGFQAIRMYMFRGDRHMVTRELEIGLRTLDDVISEALGVDVHLAHTYLLTNYDGCQNKEFCVNAYNNIAVELMRAMNFYRFSNPDSNVTDLWLCGGGAVIAPLRQAIGETLDMQIHQASELAPGGEEIEDCNEFVEAIGIAMDTDR